MIRSSGALAKTLLAGAAVSLLLWAYLSGTLKGAELTLQTHNSPAVTMESQTLANWKTTNLYEKAFPEEAKKRKGDVKITTDTVNVLGVDSYYREALPPDGVTSTGHTLLLLHGKSFKSETWQNLGTINLMAALGHHVLAVDLPGYGNTPGEQVRDNVVGRWIDVMLVALRITKVVIVSPSMSGRFAVPYLLDNRGKLEGLVAVAPIATSQFQPSDYASVKVPVVILWGSKDDTGLAEESKKHLSAVPNSLEIELSNARHPAYLDEPDKFHTVLYNFLRKL